MKSLSGGVNLVVSSVNCLSKFDTSLWCFYKKNIHFKQDSKHNSDILISVQTMGTKTGGFITGNCMIQASSLFNKGLSIWHLIGQKLLPTFEPLCLMIIQGRINFAKITKVSTAMIVIGELQQMDREALNR